MTSAIFETERVRVHITGKTAWVETREGSDWVFCNQHPLPVSGGCDDSSELKAAVDHYEETRKGDSRLRAALTGQNAHSRKASSESAARPAIVVAKPVQRPAQSAARESRPARKPSFIYRDFRAPLRPPLLNPHAAK
jgi:hypothetical protein